MHRVQRGQLPRGAEHIRPEIRKRHPADYERTKLYAREQDWNRRVDIRTGVLTRTGCVSI